MKVGDNMEIYKGYYSNKKYQFIYNIDPRIKSLKLFSLKGDLQKALSKDIDIFQISSIEIDSPIYKNIFSEGITIYDSKYNH